MKTIKKIFPVLIMMALLIQSCELNELNHQDKAAGILPERFKINIPGSLSNDLKSTSISQKSANSIQVDTLNGNAIYAHLTNFIAIGEAAADIIQDIIFAIAYYDIDEPMAISFEGDDDQRIKNLVVEEGGEYDNRIWQYFLTITDAESEGDTDGGKALQVFWNTSPIEGIAILRPYHIDRKHELEALDAVIRLEYSEAGTIEYDAYMIVEIADLPMPDPRINPYALNSLKMYVGRDGDRIDVYGNSDHPNAYFYTEKTGFNWAFVASGYDSKNIGVAEVGLPPSMLDEGDREVLLKDYSIKNVLTEEINQWFLEEIGMRPDSSDLAAYLRNADAPGFFAEQGFVQGGVSPGEEYNELVNRINDLSPFNPKSVNELQIVFN
ncbi:MAG: hypothetical protein JXB24_11145 [Bacteroidales bacterium]|nr:hypothetical protein [Bacteroidales bacterium]